MRAMKKTCRWCKHCVIVASKWCCKKKMEECPKKFTCDEWEGDND